MFLFAIMKLKNTEKNVITYHIVNNNPMRIIDKIGIGRVRVHYNFIEMDFRRG